MSARVRVMLAGVVAVGVALGVGELAAGLFAGVPSLVSAVGSALIPFVPPVVEDAAIDLFGTSDKLALTVGTTVLTLGVGAWAGVLAARRWASAVTLFVVFAGVGLLTALMQPLISPVPTVLAVLVSAAGGLAALRWLVGLTTAEQHGLARDDDGAVVASATLGDRRRFLVSLAGLAVTAAVAGASGRLLLAPRGRLSAEDLALPRPERAAPPPTPEQTFDTVEGLAPIVVPNDDFYRIDTALVVPRLQPEDWRLRIHGRVDREVEISYEELLALPMVERYVTIACVSNEVGDDLVGNARWLGVPLVDLLDRAGVGDDAEQVVGRAVDGWTAGFPVEAAFDGREALVAVGMNGEPLPREHGFPARLIVSGLYGYVSATKWLTEIELTTWDFEAYWVPRGWAQRAPVKTQSRIDVPRPGSRVDPGSTVVAGVAWAPHRGITRVELQVDGGEWEECELTEPLSDDAWVQWRRTVDLPPGGHQLKVRATDGTGETQTADLAPPRPDGATGHHTIRVRA